MRGYHNVILPACQNSSNYGLCTLAMKNDFVLGLQMSENFFNSELQMSIPQQC